MNLLFCNNPFDDKLVDADFGLEYLSAEENGFNILLFSFESLIEENNVFLATKGIEKSKTMQQIIYRGWMLKPNQYALLYNGLLAKNYRLINSPDEYQNCHYLPDSYLFICDFTPKTIWKKLKEQQVNFDEIFNAAKVFGDSPLIVKDFVKSQKHYWDTACFISSAEDKANLKSVIEKFIELQGSDLNEGLVIRKFVELNELTNHSKSGMPLKQEYRLFFINGQLLDCYNYWEEGQYSHYDVPPLGLFKSIAKSIPSNFFSMDVAKTKNGEWIVIELGDGQVTGLPESANSIQFYNGIKNYCLI